MGWEGVEGVPDSTLTCSHGTPPLPFPKNPSPSLSFIHTHTPDKPYIRNEQKWEEDVKGG